MEDIRGNLWDYFEQLDTAICITTNGFVKNNGECVMGRGCALEAKKRIPNIAFAIGQKIKNEGNHVHKIGSYIYTFPVKHVWWEEADLELIRASCKEISVIATEKNIIIPRPGCGNGKLKYSVVKPILEGELDNRFKIITF